MGIKSEGTKRLQKEILERILTYQKPDENQREFCQRWGILPQLLRQFKEVTGVSLNGIVKAIENLQADPQFLLTGTPCAPEGGPPMALPVIMTISQMNKELQETYVEKLDQKQSPLMKTPMAPMQMNGKCDKDIQVDGVLCKGKILFPPEAHFEFMAKRRSVLTVIDEPQGMAPTVAQNDFVTINLRDRELREGQMYLVVARGRLKIRFVDMLRGATGDTLIRMWPREREYNEDVIDPKRIGYQPVLGRVTSVVRLYT